MQGRKPREQRQGPRGQRSEFDQKMIDLRRVARVVAGGRRFSFRATVVLGNHKGLVGVGVGKGADASQAIDKAQREAKKHMLEVTLTKRTSIPYEVEAKYGAARVKLRPIAEGRGLVAGGAARTVLSMAGVTNTSCKILSHTKNKINNARAAFEALRIVSRAKRVRYATS